MTERSVLHATFVLERVYPAAPDRVFAYWADPALKAQWFVGPDEPSTTVELDFRVGGIERASGLTPGGQRFAYEARYDDIVPGERLVYGYTMDMDGVRISASLGTVELRPEGDGTRLTYTEQSAYLDGLDVPEDREQGSADLLDALDRVLDS